MVKIPNKIGFGLDSRLQAALQEFSQNSGAESISDVVRSLLLIGIEKTAGIDSSILKAGYRSGVNMGLALVKEKLMRILDEEMTRVDATEDLTTE